MKPPEPPGVPSPKSPFAYTDDTVDEDMVNEPPTPPLPQSKAFALTSPVT